MDLSLKEKVDYIERIQKNGIIGHNKFLKWVEAGSFAEELYKMNISSPYSETLYINYLLYKGNFEEAYTILNDKNHYNSLELSSLLQVTFEQQKWNEAHANCVKLWHNDNSLHKHLISYKLFLPRLCKDGPFKLSVPNPGNSAEKYLVDQINDFKLDRTYTHMKNLITKRPSWYPFEQLELKELLISLEDNLDGLNRGNQANCFSEPPILFDHYQFEDNNQLIEVSTIPFTKNIYGIKPLRVPKPNKKVYTLKKSTY